MGKTESFDFQDMDMNSSKTELTGNGKRKGGCYLSTPAGLILLFLVACLMAAVGVTVHLTSPENRCNCVSPTGNSGGSNSASVQNCKDLISTGSLEICSVCTGLSTPRIPVTTTSPAEVLDIRLPRSLSPEVYTVELQPDVYDGPPEHFTFNGSVKIRMKCHESTRNITLHISNLNITGTIAVSSVTSSETIEYDSHIFDKKRQFLTVHTNKPMVPGNAYEIHLVFTGPLKEDLYGLYLSSYKRDNKTMYLATTFLAPTGARKIFPCFDEPSFKALYDVTLVRKSHMKSLSNMPLLASESRGSGWIADHFNTTPPISTYLLAFIICDFNYTVGIAKNNVEYRTWSRPEAINQTKYALEIGIKILTYFENFFNLTFPLPKQDIIAIPDFAVGAMENWGLITCKETFMLYDENSPSESDKQLVAIVVSHELAHQWFGNLVTLSWWDDLWLNEGFATFVQYMGVDYIHPDWKMFEQFVVQDLQDVFNDDGLVTSHPLYVPVSHPDLLADIFDKISYGKGASIIRMMRFFLGEETFRNGLTRYLKNKEYGLAFHDDLWYALANVTMPTGAMQYSLQMDFILSLTIVVFRVISVKNIMDSWVLQMNYPVINVTITGGNIIIQQKRFLRDYEATDPGKFVSPFNYVWEVPFTFTTKSNPNFNQTNTDIYWMHKTKEEIISSNVSGSDWIIGNVKQFGFYRVTYSNDNWEKLITQLNGNHEIFDSINRAQIINDAWNLAKSGDLDMRIALQTVNYLHKEKNYIPWKAASRELSYVNSMLRRTEMYGAFSKFMKSTVKEIFNKTSLNSKYLPHLQSYTNTLIAEEACRYGIQECIDESRQQFNNWMLSSTTNNIKTSVRSIVYCTAIKYGGIEEWNFAYKMYQESNVAAEKSRLLSSLACSRDVWIINRYLGYSLIQSEIKKQDALDVIRYIARNDIGLTLAWDFIRGHWVKLVQVVFSEIAYSFSNMISGVTENFNTNFQLQQLEKFIAENPNKGSVTVAFQQALEKTKSNIKWMDKNYRVVGEWLKEHEFL